jgi:DNA repair protein RadC
MKTRIGVVTIQLVKERSVTYEAERLIRPEQAANAFRALVGHPDREIFAILILDGQNRVVSIHKVSEGSLNQSIVHPREVFKAAILANAAAIIMAHNHPTGDPTPSREDIEITRSLREGGELLGIKVLDHVIVDTESERMMSFTSQGLM